MTCVKTLQNVSVSGSVHGTVVGKVGIGNCVPTFQRIPFLTRPPRPVVHNNMIPYSPRLLKHVNDNNSKKTDVSNSTMFTVTYSNTPSDKTEIQNEKDSHGATGPRLNPALTSLVETQPATHAPAAKPDDEDQVLSEQQLMSSLNAILQQTPFVNLEGVSSCPSTKHTTTEESYPTDSSWPFPFSQDPADWGFNGEIGLLCSRHSIRLTCLFIHLKYENCRIKESQSYITFRLHVHVLPLCRWKKRSYLPTLRDNRSTYTYNVP